MNLLFHICQWYLPPALQIVRRRPRLYSPPEPLEFYGTITTDGITNDDRPLVSYAPA